ncbi:MAG: NUDIX hydrolase [Gammaproteobacteria bacterium]|nr:NUDIX hydrolase [Gammaproteobacteria bacterium]
MKYCCYCANPVVLKIPAKDNLPRYTCENCGAVHYQNPKIVAGCIATWEDKILLCRRAIEPRYGLWTVPAGFMENNETVAQAAARETFEEATAKVDNLTLHSLFNIPHINQVYIVFAGNLAQPETRPGLESLEVNLVEEQDMPWDEIAFPVIRRTLELFFDRSETPPGHVYVGDIGPKWGGE